MSGGAQLRVSGVVGRWTERTNCAGSSRQRKYARLEGERQSLNINT